MLVGGRAARAYLGRARDHLLEVRVARKIIGKPAGRGRIRAAELNHGRRAACLVVIGVEGERIRRCQGKPQGGIDAAERVIPSDCARFVEAHPEIARVGVDAVAGECFGVARVAHRCGQVQELARRQCIREVKPEDLIGAAQGNDGLVVERAVIVDERVIRWRSYCAVLERLRKGIAGVVVADAGDGLVLEAKEIMRIGELRAESRGALGRERSRVLARLAIGNRGASRQRRTGDRRAG